jgi:thiamine kinase-like enzyme
MTGSELPQKVASAVMRLWPGATPHVEALPGGMTNANYVVEVAGGRFVLQLQMPADAAAVLGIDRARQRRAHAYAAGAGIAPQVLQWLPDLQVSVCEWLDGASLPGLGQRSAETVARLAEALRTLHAGPSDETMRSPVADPFSGTEALVRSARSVSPTAAAQFDFARPFMDRFHGARGPGATSLTHGDLLASNILCCADGIRIIDYEYAAVGDPLYDLGELAGKNDFTEAETRALVDRYDDGATPDTLSVVWLYRILAVLREGLWAVTASTNALDFDYFQYAAACRCKVAGMLAQPETARHLKTLEAAWASPRR